MKKTISFSMALLLLLALVSTPFLSANALTPTTRADYESWFPTEVTILEQKFGQSNLGDTSAHSAPLSLGTYQYQFTAVNNIFADQNDVTVNNYEDDLVLTFTGSNLPKSVCLGVIATNQSGAYLSGISISYSVNGGTDAVYTTKTVFADNALVITDEGGISTVVLKAQSNVWGGYSYILLPSVNKLPQDAPAAPALQSEDGTSVTLTPITGVEYSMDGTPWQDSNEFTGLSPVTAYTFYARLKATETFFVSPSSTGTDITTGKADQQAPAAPSVQSKTAASVTLTPITGAEYSKDGTTWQDSNEFTGLSPATAYTFYARLKETDTLTASPSSTGTAATTDKADQQAPAAPSVQSKTAASVTLTPITGAEYSKDGTVWQDSNVFTGLMANTTYTFYARYKGTDTLNPSAASQLSVTTLKASDSSPATGDSLDLLLWVSILSAAAALISITAIMRIRTKNQTEK